MNDVWKKFGVDEEVRETRFRHVSIRTTQEFKVDILGQLLYDG